jgi:hypothetical protein
MFAQQKDPSRVKMQELRWAIYVFCTWLEADEALIVGRESFDGAYRQLVATYPRPTRPNVKWEIGDETIDVVMDELDIADRGLTPLMGWYDRRTARGFLSAEAQAQSEPYNKRVSMIVPLVEAGGDEGPRQNVQLPQPGKGH